MIDWPFDDPPNVAVITTKRIMRGEYPILCVVHDDAEGEWQFLDGFDCTVAEASVVGLKTMVNHDQAVLELADLPFGWYAKRTDVDSSWVRAKIPLASEHIVGRAKGFEAFYEDRDGSRKDAD